MGNKKHRNKLCKCGSGLKYKDCCLRKEKNIVRHIPEEIKREVIKQLGPFCILCGLPSFELHHIENYAKLIKRGINPHTVENIVPLCEIHHRRFVHHDKITQTILKEKREEIIKNPDIKSTLYTKKVPPVVFIGNNNIVNTKNIFVRGQTNTPVFSVDESEGNLLINARFQDQNNNDILVIKNNEWIINKNNIWALTVEMGNEENFELSKDCAKLTFSTNDKRLSEYAGLEIELIPNIGVKIINAKFYCFGNLLEVKEDGELILNKTITISNCCVYNCGGFMAF